MPTGRSRGFAFAVAASSFSIASCVSLPSAPSAAPVSPATAGVLPAASTVAASNESTNTSSTFTPVVALPGAYLDAATVAASIPVTLEHRGQPGYARDDFHGWTTIDGCDTRQAVLQRDRVDTKRGGCDVSGATWMSWYDDVSVTDPSELDIDHMVPLKEAWDSGAWAWTPQRRDDFADDLSDSRTLQVATVESNRSKGDRDPSNWLPSDEKQVCRYIGDWVAVKARWGLTMDESEAGRIRNILRRQCAGWQIAGWPASPAD